MGIILLGKSRRESLINFNQAKIRDTDHYNKCCGNIFLGSSYEEWSPRASWQLKKDDRIRLCVTGKLGMFFWKTSLSFQAVHRILRLCLISAENTSSRLLYVCSLFCGDGCRDPVNVHAKWRRYFAKRMGPRLILQCLLICVVLCPHK